MQERFCLVCGSEFKPRSWQQHCCCKACAHERVRALAQGQVMHVHCLRCNKVFTTMRRKNIYCSKECEVAAVEQNQIVKFGGDYHPWRCHDCGRPSETYRCPDCAAAWKRRHKECFC